MSFIEELKKFEMLEGERRVVERLRRMGFCDESKRPQIEGSAVLQFPLVRPAVESDKSAD